MTTVSRRRFMHAAGTAALAASRHAGANEEESRVDDGLLSRVGAALYTVRDSLGTQPRETLEGIARIGYRYVEGATPDLYPLLKDTGLAQVSDYAPTYVITGNRAAWAATGFREMLPEGTEWAAVVDDAAGRGLEYLVFVYLLPQERGGPDVYRALAAKLNEAGKACRGAGIQLCYHAHSFEFEPTDGVRPLDLLLRETDPAFLALELDVFWASVAGVDPASYIATHSGRVPLLHLKDKAEGTPLYYDETKVPRTAFREVGHGGLDYGAILTAARSSGVRYAYVEQDHCEGDPLESLRVSYESLRTLLGTA